MREMNAWRVDVDKSGGHYYIHSMTSTAQLLREIETMPEEAAAEVLDFALFIKGKYAPAQPFGVDKPSVPSIKDAHGIFRDLKGMDTTIERDEEDRV